MLSQKDQKQGTEVCVGVCALNRASGKGKWSLSRDLVKSRRVP